MCISLYLTIQKSHATMKGNQYCVASVSTPGIWNWIVTVDHNPNCNVLFDVNSSCIDGLVLILWISASICNMVIVPLFLYCSLLKPTLTQTQVNRILSFERRAKEIIGYKQRQKKQVNLVNIRKQRICSFVHKVAMGEVGDPFENYSTPCS